MTTPDPAAPARTRDKLLAAAIAVLTEPARLTPPVLTREDAASQAAGSPVWTPSGEREPDDWAEFVTHALACAAANMGGIEKVLSGRPESWEADYLRNLLTSTVLEQYLHRTAPSR